MKEVWKDIPGFEGFYQVSNKGQIKSLSRELINKNGKKSVLKEKIMKKQLFNTGYYKVRLTDNEGDKKNYFIHRLMMLAFVGDSDKQVNHIDGVKTNNVLENIEYVTPRDNLVHAYDTGLRPSATKIYGKEIIDLYKKGSTQRYLMKRFNISSNTLRTYLEKNGVKVRTNMEANRKYNIDFKEFKKMLSEGLPNKTVADHFGVPIGTVNQYKSQIKRGRRKF